MARKKIVETQTVLNLIQEYFIKECNGNPDLLKKTAITKYISEKTNTNYNYDVLRKTPEAINYIQQLKDTSEAQNFATVSTYKTLDIDKLLLTNTTKSSLKAALLSLDSHYKTIADSAATIFKKFKEYDSEIASLKETLITKETAISALNKEKEKLLKEKRELSAHNKNLKDFIEDNVYPEFCNHLLQEDGLLKNNNKTVLTQDAINTNIIDSDTDIFSESNVIQGLFDRYKGED